MSERMIVATRKGLLQLARKNGAWNIVRTSFPGVAVTAALHDKRDGTLYAMLKHGHFGAKLHRSDDEGRSWTELTAQTVSADAGGQTRATRMGRGAGRALQGTQCRRGVSRWPRARAGGCHRRGPTR